MVVIDGGKGQLAAGLRALQGFRDRGVIGDLAGQADRGGVHPRARRRRCVLAHDTPELQLLQRVRDEAHRFAITHHRIRRDRAMTASILDELPGVGPGPQARAAGPLRLAGRDPGRLPRGARGGAGAAGQAGARDVPRAAQDRGLSPAASRVSRAASVRRVSVRARCRRRRRMVSIAALAAGTVTV